MIEYTKDISRINWEEAANVIKLAPLGSREPEKMKRAFQNSFIKIFAFDNSKLIGIGRAICDGEYQAVIYDMAVLPEYQGKGVGKKIMEEMCNGLPVGCIILYATPGKEEFYKKCGFRKMLTAMAKLTPWMSDPKNGFLE